MFEIKEGSLLKEEEKFDIIRSKPIDKEVWDYLSNQFQNLTIEITSRYKGNIIELMKINALEGWCYETTESSIVFLNKDDYIARGSLRIEEDKRYSHAWIHFISKNKEYAFDPCLNILCEKDLYSKVFEVDVKSKVYKEEVLEELIRRIYLAKQKREQESEMEKEVRNMFISILGTRCEGETYIKGSNDDIFSPMYRSCVGYKPQIEGTKVKKLTAHFYDNLA